ncbi:MAG: glycosyltransferase family 2 protein [Oscillospiraceae bacterium]
MSLNIEKQPLISVIVPVYNVEKYIHKCVSSIINQTYKNLEIILVDDGSPDNCGEICDEYAKKDCRIKVIHKKNGGLSDARNAGIDSSNGDYIAFVDSDDYISQDMYQQLIPLLLQNNADVVMFSVFDCYNDKVSRAYKKEDKVFICDGKECFKIILQGELGAFAWNRIYKKDLFNDIKFKVGKITEDAFFNAEVVQKINVAVINTKAYYYYVHRENSITTSNYSKKDLDTIEAYEFTFNIVKEKYPNLMKEAYFRYYWSNFIVLDKMLRNKNFKEIDEYRKIVKILKKNFWDIFTNDLFQNSRRISALALKINVKLYKMLLMINEKNKV